MSKHWKNREEGGRNLAETLEHSAELEVESAELETETSEVHSAELVEGAETETDQEPKPITMGIGQFVRHLLLKSNKTNAEVLDLVRTTFPDSKTTPGCIAWYRSDLRKKGLLPANAGVRSTKIVAFTPEMLAEMVK
jgi:hypothetical protein